MGIADSLYWSMYLIVKSLSEQKRGLKKSKLRISFHMLTTDRNDFYTNRFSFYFQSTEGLMMLDELLSVYKEMQCHGEARHIKRKFSKWENNDS